MSIFSRLFPERQELSAEVLRGALGELEKDGRRQRTELRRSERRRRQTFDRLKRSRAAGNKLEVDDLWEEFKDQRRSVSDLRREGRASMLEGLALRRCLRALERLERRRDRDAAGRLLARLSASGLLERFALHREEERSYLEEMNSILDEFQAGEGEEREDPEKALFLAELDRIQRAEASGDSAEAGTRRDDLLERFADAPENESQ